VILHFMISSCFKNSSFSLQKIFLSTSRWSISLVLNVWENNSLIWFLPHSSLFVSSNQGERGKKTLPLVFIVILMALFIDKIKRVFFILILTLSHFMTITFACECEDE
jgi:hypothetical protein